METGSWLLVPATAARALGAAGPLWARLVAEANLSKFTARGRRGPSRRPAWGGASTPSGSRTTRRPTDGADPSLRRTSFTGRLTTSGLAACGSAGQGPRRPGAGTRPGRPGRADPRSRKRQHRIPHAASQSDAGLGSQEPRTEGTPEVSGFGTAPLTSGVPSVRGSFDPTIVNLLQARSLGRQSPARITSRKRGPWTPLMRVISMSAVAEGPETNVVGRSGSSRAKASGTVSTTWSTVTTHRW